MNEQAPQFDVQRAMVDPAYLEENAVIADEFASANLSPDSFRFIEALEIKATLGMQVDATLLSKALKNGAIDRQYVIRYLARISVPRFDAEIINIINAFITYDINVYDGDIFWAIKALALCQTKRARLYIGGLRKKNELMQNPIIKNAMDYASEILGL